MDKKAKTFFKKLFFYFLLFLIICYPIGCLNPFITNLLRNQIKEGMTFEEAEKVRTYINIPMDMTSYMVDIPTSSTDKRWQDFKEEVARATGTKKMGFRWTLYESRKKQREYLIISKKAKFETILKIIAQNPEKYGDVVAYIDICLVGPAFQKNEFYIYIGIDGRVKNASGISNWD